jgi:hypothetical protein
MGFGAWLRGEDTETVQEKIPTPVKAKTPVKAEASFSSPDKKREVIYDPASKKLLYADTLEPAPDDDDVSHPFFRNNNKPTGWGV